MSAAGQFASDAMTTAEKTNLPSSSQDKDCTHEGLQLRLLATKGQKGAA